MAGARRVTGTDVATVTGTRVLVVVGRASVVLVVVVVDEVVAGAEVDVEVGTVVVGSSRVVDDAVTVVSRGSGSHAARRRRKRIPPSRLMNLSFRHLRGRP